MYRQDSEQWDALHPGRVTTSVCASCLGCYEPWASKVLKVPACLQGHNRALQAQQRLSQPLLTDFNQLAISPPAPPSDGSCPPSPWGVAAEGPFLMSYNPPSAPKPAPTRGSLRDVRLAWGNHQEPTSMLLAVLHHLSSYYSCAC